MDGAGLTADFHGENMRNNIVILITMFLMICPARVFAVNCEYIDSPTMNYIEELVDLLGSENDLYEKVAEKCYGDLSKYEDFLDMYRCIDSIVGGSLSSAFLTASNEFANSECYQDLMTTSPDDNVEIITGEEGETIHYKQPARELARRTFYTGKQVSSVADNSSGEDYFEDELAELEIEIKSIEIDLKYEDDPKKIEYYEGLKKAVEKTIEETKKALDIQTQITDEAVREREQEFQNWIDRTEMFADVYDLKNVLLQSLYEAIENMISNYQIWDYKFYQHTSPFMSMHLDRLPLIGECELPKVVRVGEDIPITCSNISPSKLFKYSDSCESFNCSVEAISTTTNKCSSDPRDPLSRSQVCNVYAVYTLPYSKTLWGGKYFGFVKMELNNQGIWKGTLKWNEIVTANLKAGSEIRFAFVARDVFGNYAVEDLFPDEGGLISEYALPTVDVICPGLSRTCYPVLDGRYDTSMDYNRYDTDNITYNYSTKYYDVECCKDDGCPADASYDARCERKPWGITGSAAYDYAGGFDIKGVKIKFSGSSMSLQIDGYDGKAFWNGGGLSQLIGSWNENEFFAVSVKLDGTKEPVSGKWSESYIGLFSNEIFQEFGLPELDDINPTGPAHAFNQLVVHAGCIASDIQDRYWFQGSSPLYKRYLSQCVKGMSGLEDFSFIEDGFPDRVLVHQPNYNLRDFSAFRTGNTINMSGRIVSTLSASIPISIKVAASSIRESCGSDYYNQEEYFECNNVRTIDNTMGINYYRRPAGRTITLEPGRPGRPYVHRTECNNNSGKDYAKCDASFPEGYDDNVCRIYWIPPSINPDYLQDIEYNVYVNDESNLDGATRLTSVNSLFQDFTFEDTELGRRDGIEGNVYHYMVTAFIYDDGGILESYDYAHFKCELPYQGSGDFTEEATDCETPSPGN